jgi:hypothetical protein
MAVSERHSVGLKTSWTLLMKRHVCTHERTGREGASRDTLIVWRDSVRGGVNPRQILEGEE